jgi:hypothetical protein
MTSLVTLLGILIFAVAVVCAARPAVFRRIVATVATPAWLYAAVVFQVVTGSLLLLAARQALLKSSSLNLLRCSIHHAGAPDISVLRSQ